MQEFNFQADDVHTRINMFIKISYKTTQSPGLQLLKPKLE